ncbi:MAG: hypothetical protein EON91_08620 [Brevundimonas sp.]|uniref:hypothetical protein n=1 Tax=Brevundimonas sp. TaxID=1871086 RepID=UPI00120CCBD5|nr:hypothetical protein [Brevundimonas sp.]RZJ17652.1 MAG: hypothetical protein EON91_08620 [Brevundimonas sp.]
MAENGRFDDDDVVPQLIGDRSHLSSTALIELEQAAALDVLRRTTAAGLGELGSQVLLMLLVLWQRQRRERSDRSFVVAVMGAELEDLCGLSEAAMLEGLQQLRPFIRVDDTELYFDGDIEVGLEPLFADETGVGAQLDRFWRASHVQMMQRAAREAGEAIESFFRLADRRGSAQGLERLVALRLQWRRHLEQRRLLDALNFTAALADLQGLHDELATLERIHDSLGALVVPGRRARDDLC